MGKLKLTWNGHSCFTLEENGYAGSFAFADPGIQAPSETYYIVTYERER